MKPRSYANKYPACKITRAVVTVRCACIRRVIIVAILAIGRRPNICRTPELNCNLSMSSTTRHEHEESDHKHIL
jgi:hypothetical protein